MRDTTSLKPRHYTGGGWTSDPACGATPPQASLRKASHLPDVTCAECLTLGRARMERARQRLKITAVIAGIAGVLLALVFMVWASQPYQETVKVGTPPDRVAVRFQTQSDGLVDPSLMFTKTLAGGRTSMTPTDDLSSLLDDFFGSDGSDVGVAYRFSSMQLARALDTSSNTTPVSVKATIVDGVNRGWSTSLTSAESITTSGTNAYVTITLPTQPTRTQLAHQPLATYVITVGMSLAMGLFLALIAIKSAADCTRELKDSESGPTAEHAATRHPAAGGDHA